MSSLVSKRKRPDREEKPVKEVTKIAGKVFDDKTVVVLVKMLNSGSIDSIDYPLAGGKEAIVFRASSKQGFLAVKVYKYETSSFRHMAKYIDGDPRFRVGHSQRGIVKEWARKEYANLFTCFEAGIRVPRPIACKDNVVVMEFLGEGGIPSALLEEVVVEKPAELLEQILGDVRKMYGAGLVHADLSAFNIIMHSGKPFIIDVGQAVLLEHPLAQEFLEKDVSNVLKFFAALGVRKDKDKVIAWIKAGE